MGQLNKFFDTDDCGKPYVFHFRDKLVVLLEIISQINICTMYILYVCTHVSLKRINMKIWCKLISNQVILTTFIGCDTIAAVVFDKTRSTYTTRNATILIAVSARYWFRACRLTRVSITRWVYHILTGTSGSYAEINIILTTKNALSTFTNIKIIN